VRVGKLEKNVFTNRTLTFFPVIAGTILSAIYVYPIDFSGGPCRARTYDPLIKSQLPIPYNSMTYVTRLPTKPEIR